MKKLVRLLSLLVILLLPLAVLAQSGTDAPTGIFSKIGEWFSNGWLYTAIGVLLALIPYAITLGVKKFAHNATPIFKEVGEFFTDLSSLSSAIDNAIKDDGKIEQNSIKEVLDAGKEVIAEGKDVIISIKPK